MGFLASGWCFSGDALHRAQSCGSPLWVPRVPALHLALRCTLWCPPPDDPTDTDGRSVPAALGADLLKAVGRDGKCTDHVTQSWQSSSIPPQTHSHQNHGAQRGDFQGTSGQETPVVRGAAGGDTKHLSLL